ncbi:MAG TPA: TonB-dependent receptor plug domain-containing protein, partial [Flavisolibacter sp.]|nr:TonB-dependent receptor plug domain-containing protein [Flavisolibacter sp.]
MRFFLLLLLLSGQVVYSQGNRVSGMVLENGTGRPVDGAAVTLLGRKQVTRTDERGQFTLQAIGLADSLFITSIGYQPLTISLADFRKLGNKVLLEQASIQLNTVTVATAAGEQFRPISKLDIKMRGINNSQEVLRMVPGLFIGQHAGGGKAEQIFLRGFDLDHGTDINISVDGMPVNMVSHAHGQGYADLHFVIPELIDNVTFKKGTYYAEKGNFATTGFVDFKTLNALPRNSIKVEAGMFHTARVLAMVNLLNERAATAGQHAYIASEYMYTKGYFDNPQ